MEVRSADGDDRSAIRKIAGRSFQTSYALSPKQIETIAENAFSDDALADRLADPDVEIFVMADGGDLVGFVDVEIGDPGGLRWLHVHPDARGEGVGTALVELARERLRETGRPFSARVLESATEGETFLERFGLRQSDSVEVELAGESFHEQLYTSDGPSKEANEPSVEVPDTLTIDGDELPVERDESIPGTDAPFFVIYRDEVEERRHGFFCSNCGSTDVAADGLDRLECGGCENAHRADEWDDAYL